MQRKGLSEQEANRALQGTDTAAKNTLLHDHFALNYNDEPALYRKGSLLFREEMQVEAKQREDGTPVMRMRTAIRVTSEDLIGESFWRTHPQLL